MAVYHCLMPVASFLRLDARSIRKCKKNKFSFVLRSLNRIFAVVKAKITIMAVYDSLRSVQESFPYDKDNTAASETQWYLEQMVSCSQKDFQEGNVYTQDEVREMLLNRKL